jgi:hypothetical protein
VWSVRARVHVVCGDRGACVVWVPWCAGGGGAAAARGARCGGGGRCNRARQDCQPVSGPNPIAPLELEPLPIAPLDLEPLPIAPLDLEPLPGLPQSHCLFAIDGGAPPPATKGFRVEGRGPEHSARVRDSVVDGVCVPLTHDVGSRGGSRKGGATKTDGTGGKGKGSKEA